jgi:hypothetical protein
MLFAALYVLCFAALLSGAITLMARGFGAALGRRADRSAGSRSRHPESPEPGEVLLYVDLSRERLEHLYQHSS